MAKQKKPRLVFERPLKLNVVESIKRKSRSPFLESFQLSPKKQNHLQDSNSMIGISNGINFLHQCRPHHMNCLCMSCGHYFSMPYFCPACSYNSWMSSPPRYFCPDYITNKEPVINESSPADNDHFHCRNRSTQRNIR